MKSKIINETVFFCRHFLILLLKLILQREVFIHHLKPFKIAQLKLPRKSLITHTKLDLQLFVQNLPTFVNSSKLKCMICHIVVQFHQFTKTNCKLPCECYMFYIDYNSVLVHYLCFLII